MLVPVTNILRLFPKHAVAVKFSTQGTKIITGGITMSFNYPEARRDESIKDDYHGTEIADPYRWLEDPFSEETKKFVDAQNSVTLPYINACPHYEAIRKCMTDSWNYPKLSVPYRFGDKYFQSKNTGLQNQDVIYRKDSLHSEDVVFLDPNALSEDGTVALVSKRFSKNGKIMAYGLSTSGSDWIEIRFRHADTAKDYEEVLRKVKFSPIAWLHSNEAIFYGAYLDRDGSADGFQTETMQNQKLYHHKIGTDQSQDFVVADFEDPQILMGANVSFCGKYVVITPRKGTKNNLIYYAHIKNNTVAGKLQLHPVVTDYEADYEYITNNGAVFLFRTNKDAPNYRIVLIDFNDPDSSKWQDLIPEHPKDVLNWCMPINTTKLVICYLRDVKSVLQLHDMKTGEKFYDFNLDIGSVVAISGKRRHTEMFFSFCSFLVPSVIYRVGFSGTKVQVEVLHTTTIGQLDASNFRTQQIFYKSKDGTQIPMFIVTKKDLVRDSERPCLLYGYGGFNIKISPSFSVSRLLFVKNCNGVFALANIRGGGEYGVAWHNAARFEKKQNSFDDFQEAAKYLIANQYTCAKKIVIQGGSNGGLLVAACINQAPNLFGAAICHVGVLDMFRYHKFTIGYAWKADYGCADVPEEFKYISKYSPLHNIAMPEEGQYPATLLLTADHDDRVVPLHSLKFIAELQHTVGKSPNQKNPLMIRIDTRAGHGAGKPTSKVIEDMTGIFAFICNALEIDFKE